MVGLALLPVEARGHALLLLPGEPACKEVKSTTIHSPPSTLDTQAQKFHAMSLQHY